MAKITINCQMDQTAKPNIILTGMPGAGKSTVGIILAKQTAREFIDSDVAIQVAEGRSLQDIVDNDGYMELRAVEERIILAIDVHNHVVSTGGSAIYSEKAMRHLKRSGPVVYLKTNLNTIRSRIQDFATRGIARQPGQDMESLLKERSGLYERYADLTITCDDLNQEQVARRIAAQIV